MTYKVPHVLITRMCYKWWIDFYVYNIWKEAIVFDNKNMCNFVALRTTICKMNIFKTRMLNLWNQGYSLIKLFCKIIRPNINEWELAWHQGTPTTTSAEIARTLNIDYLVRIEITCYEWGNILCALNLLVHTRYKCII